MTRALVTLALVIAATALPAAAEPNDVNGLIAYERRGFLRIGAEIWTMNQDGTTLRRLVSGTDPAWSPDGRRLAFVAATGSLTTIDADGTGTRVVEVTGLPPDHRGRIRRPAWSPDGSMIAFGTQEGLHVVSATGGPARLVAAAFEPAPSWSPDGSTLSFVGDGSVEIVRADGSGRRAIPGARSYGARRVGWSPDGSTLAFGDSQTGGIATVGLDGRPPRQLVPYTGGSEAADAVWSPDGARIAFVDNNTDICVVNADGSGLGRLTYAPIDAANLEPTWQPLPSGAAPAGSPRGRLGPVEGWDRSQSWGMACERRQAGRVLSATATPARVRVGDVVTLRLWMENRGDAPVGEHGIAGVGTTVDGGARLLSTRSTRGRCVPRRTECNLETIFPGERLFVTVRVRVVQPGEIIFASHLPWAASFAPPSQRPDAMARVDVLGCTTRGTGRSEVLAGSRRVDVLCGLRGDDRIRPGAGRDAIYAGAGDDVVYARDGRVDRVFCGTGTDSVFVDRSDRVGRDCERVIRS